MNSYFSEAETGCDHTTEGDCQAFVWSSWLQTVFNPRTETG